VRTHASSCSSEIESFFESPGCGTHLFPTDYGGSEEPYSGSFLRRMPHWLAESRTQHRLSSLAISVIRQQRLERGQDRPCLLDRLLCTRQRSLGDAAVVGGLAKIQ
jgi:hypothetical protein